MFSKRRIIITKQWLWIELWHIPCGRKLKSILNTTQIISKTHGDITKSTNHNIFFILFYSSPYDSAMNVIWKIFMSNAVLYFSRSQAKMSILKFSDYAQLQPKDSLELCLQPKDSLELCLSLKRPFNNLHLKIARRHWIHIRFAPRNWQYKRYSRWD